MHLVYGGATTAQPKLLDQVRDRLRLKHHSLRTEDAFLHWMRRFIHFHRKRHPREMGGPDRRNKRFGILAT